MTFDPHVPAALACALALAVAAPVAAQSVSAGGGSEQAQEGAAAEGGSDAGGSQGSGSESSDGGQERAVTESGSGHPEWAVAYEENGRYYTEEDIPTFNITEDGTVDWLTYSGFRRYHAECHTCHGPDGMGSSYAPALVESVMNMDYYDFYDVVVNGRQNVSQASNQVMPAFGENPNVMCYLDDIYVYLRARGSGELPRGRPAENEDKSEAIQEAERACMGT